jgi:hypothetical protein
MPVILEGADGGVLAYSIVQCDRAAAAIALVAVVPSIVKTGRRGEWDEGTRLLQQRGGAPEFADASAQLGIAASVSLQVKCIECQNDLK